jgi:Family of unknown function (DUF5941)
MTISVEDEIVTGLSGQAADEVPDAAGSGSADGSRLPAAATPTTVAAPGARASSEAPVLAARRVLAAASVTGLSWARRRHIKVSSACGISLAMAVCAAAWLSAGTRSGDIYGVTALWAGYLVTVAARRLAGQQIQDRSSASGPALPGAGTRAAGPRLPTVRPGELARPMPTVPGVRPELRLADPSPGQRPAISLAGSSGWLVALAGCVAECIVYAGLAVGAAAEGWTGVWPLAVAVLGLAAVRDLMTACSNPPGVDGTGGGVSARLARAVLTMPLGGRVLVIGIVAPAWGARAALLALLDWAIISIGYGVAGRVSATDVSHTLRRLRDDGALARSLGRLVKGNLPPLPPAILGLAAVSTLAIIGLHDLPGLLMIGPAIILLLAAPGSANQHVGRFDWLVPVLLLGAQYLYLVATGLAAGVPGPVIFALCAVLLVRYRDLALPGRPVLRARRRSATNAAERGMTVGWEGRVLLAGSAAAMGIATFGYLAMAAYFGVLIGAKVVTSCLMAYEDVGP